MLYIMGGFARYAALMPRLGRFRTGGACPHIKQLDNVHLPTLKKLIRESVKLMSKAHK